MKTLATITAAILLTACGGESSSSNNDIFEEVEAATPPSVKVIEGYSKVLKNCGGELEAVFKVLNISDESKKIKSKPESNEAKANISGSSHNVCINGSVTKLNVSGSSHNIYINGSIGALNVTGSSVDVYVFGGIASANVAGSSHNIYTQEIATFNNSAENSGFMNISDVEL